VNYFYTK